jgi:hypothetical protein
MPVRLAACDESSADPRSNCGTYDRETEHVTVETKKLGRGWLAYEAE